MTPDTGPATAAEILAMTQIEAPEDIHEPHEATVLTLDRSADRVVNGRVELGRPRATAGNVRRVLETDPHYDGQFRRNLFSGRMERAGRTLEDVDDIQIAHEMDTVYGMAVIPRRVHEAVMGVCAQASYHPVRGWLDGLVWDGIERAGRWVSTYLGAADGPLTRAYSRRFLLSALSRVYRPGCKVDTMLVLKGEQGTQKSTALEALAVNPAWYSDASIDIQHKDAALCLQGVWIFEFAELDRFKGRAREGTKAFLTRRVDRFRAPYGAHVADYERQTVFVGSTNDEEFLNDPTGSRRYWVVETGGIDVGGLRRDAAQIWAEAVTWYRSGEQHWLTAQEDAHRAASNEQYEEGDTWDEVIERWILAQGKSQLTVAEVLLRSLEIPPGLQRRVDQHRAADALRRLGYKRTRRQVQGQRMRVWERMGD